MQPSDTPPANPSPIQDSEMREHTASFRKAMEAVLAKDASLRAQASELRVLQDDGFLSEIDSEDIMMWCWPK